MHLDKFQAIVGASIRERSDELGLVADCIEVEYLLNWGGFVNRSFRISDGRKCFHLKLADQRETRAALQRWRGLDGMLRPYHAPCLVTWVDLPELSSAGLLTEWIEGKTPARMTRELVERVIPVVRTLHEDSALAARIGGQTTCAATYLETYNDRFTADLREISLHRPPFVTPETVHLMHEEAALLEATVQGSTAFNEVVDSPIHADLWANNFLVTVDGDWHILDWDDLSVGDPIIDFAMLLGPSASDLQPVHLAGPIEPFLESDAERERLSLYARASLLDWVIDSLADYIEADAAPEYAAEVRTEKSRIHFEALDRYVTLYTSGRP